MSDILIPVTTVWDIVANALDDVWFWILSGVGMAAISLVARFRVNRRWS